MKRLFFLLSVTILLFSCNSPESKLKEALKDVVIEKAGFNPDYEFISMEIDTVTVKDINDFIEKQFPKDEYPNGLPSDFKSKKFEAFTAPLETKKNDSDICFLSVKHKYSIDNPFFGKRVEVIRHDLFEEIDGSYKYIGEDIRKDDLFSDIFNYKIKEQDQEFEERMRREQEQMDNTFNAIINQKL